MIGSCHATPGFCEACGMSSMSEPSAITGLPFAPGRHPRGRNPGDAALDLEAFLLQDSGEIFRRLEFLESELAETEDAVHHHLRLLFHAVDLAGQIGLYGSFFLGRGLVLPKQTQGGNGENQRQTYTSAYFLSLGTVYANARAVVSA